MEGFAHSNEFCPNEECPDYGKLQKDQSEPNLMDSSYSLRSGERQEGVFVKIGIWNRGVKLIAE